MVRKNPIQLTLIDKEMKTDDDGNTFYEYHYSYVGRGGEIRYKTVKRSYSKVKSGRKINANKMFDSVETTIESKDSEQLSPLDSDISEP